MLAGSVIQNVVDAPKKMQNKVLVLLD